MMNKGTAVIGFILSFIAGMMLMWGINRQQGGGAAEATADSAGAQGQEAAAVPVSPTDASWGNPNAPVTVVLFSDFECPFCSRVGAALDQAKQTYGKDKLRIVWKHNPLPFHKNAKPASVAAETVRALGGNDAFWKFHDEAFKNQKDLTPENFEKWAAEAKVDMKKYKAAIEANTYAAKVDKDLALAKKLGVRGTPHSLVNGVAVGGAQPFPKFKEVIDEQLTKAQALVKAGTKASDVYAKLTAENFKAGPPADDDKSKDRKPPEEDKTVWKVPLLGDAPAKGAKDALVTIVEFSDFQCPFCKRVEPTFEQLMKDYEGKIRLVWMDRPLPFHKRAEPAAVFAREARRQKGDKAFWDAHAKLYDNQQKLEDADLEGYAKELGLDWGAIKKAIETKKYEKEIQAQSELADSLQARGTPHMFVNGRRLVGAQPVEKFKEIVDEQLKIAEELAKKGTPKDKVYDEIMKDAKEPPPPPPPEKKEVPPPTADNPWKGAKNAKIVIQIWSEFECPFCARLEPTIAQVLETYKDKVKVVWHHMPLPFHKSAPLASEAAVEVFKQKGNDAFWKFHDKLFENQKALDRESLEKYAAELGVDMAKFKAALDNNTHKEFVEKDAKIGNDAGIRGTPGIVINGYFIGGAQPFPEFKKIIDLAEKELK